MAFQILIKYFRFWISLDKILQIVFSFTPNSAGAERVFSLLKAFFGDTRTQALADILQATLMLRYNKRSVGHSS